MFTGLVDGAEMGKGKRHRKKGENQVRKVRETLIADIPGLAWKRSVRDIRVALVGLNQRRDLHPMKRRKREKLTGGRNGKSNHGLDKIESIIESKLELLGKTLHILYFRYTARTDLPVRGRTKALTNKSDKVVVVSGHLDPYHVQQKK
jgi:hypothetical protein